MTTRRPAENVTGADVSSTLTSRESAETGAKIRIEVEWADIAKSTGDVFVVGHYVDVLPQNAEHALDEALSSVNPLAAGKLLADLTRRGAIRGALGDVNFFPWKDRGHVVLAGMGRPGSFKEPQLQILAASLTQSVVRLMPNPVICTVLIGAGVGNLNVAQAVSGMVHGIASALAAERTPQRVTVRIVEYYLNRAYEIFEAVKESSEEVRKKFPITVDTAADVIERDDTGGVIPIPFGFSMILASVAQACFDGDSSPLKKTVEDLASQLPTKLQGPVRESLKVLGKQRNLRRLGLAFRIDQGDPPPIDAIADRISFSHDGALIHGSAITNLTTVSASTLEVSLTGIDRIVELLRAPSEPIFLERGRRAFRSLVHPVLREKLEVTNPLVLELDRTMARVPWELIHNGRDPLEPLSIRRPVSRQLRTTYSPRPSDVAVRPTWKALVIGDADGTLPAAAEEAKLVAKVLERHDLKVDLRIGPPDELDLGSVQGIAPADLFEIIELLQSGEYDIVHFAGHASFDGKFPDRSGWQFKGDDVLTASKLEGVERAPRLIVANACVSAGLSDPAATGAAATERPRDSGIVASLADEFFRRGVADYIGTAWEVPEQPAMLFAELLYKNLFADWKGNQQGTSLGEAVQRARADMFARRTQFGDHPSVWAAYQHYGDPTRTLADYRS